MLKTAKHFIPHKYQAISLEHLDHTPKAALFLDCGMGKTVITLTHLCERLYDYFDEDIKRILIIAPKKVAEDTWTNEQSKWDHLEYLRFSKVLGKPQQRLKALEKDADIYLINRELVPWLVAGFEDNWPFDTVVVDELSSFKSPSSDRFRALKQVIDSGKVQHFIGLTGTPQPNGLMDLWSQIYLIDGGKRLGKTIGAYQRKYFSKDVHTMQVRKKGGGYRQTTFTTYEPLAGAEKEIHDKIKDIVISLTAEDWLDVPEAIYTYDTVTLSKAEKKLVDQLTRERAIQLEEDGVPIVASNAGQISQKLLQIANGAVYDEEHNVREIHDKKLDKLEELIEAANGKPVMVFYWFQYDYDRICKRLAKQKFRISNLKTSKERDLWNAGKIDIALAHPASMGHGLNLQDGGNIIVWFSLTDSLELYIQANKRLHRQGQRQKVLIHHIVCEGTHDEDAIANLNSKDGSQKRLIEALKARLKLEEE